MDEVDEKFDYIECVYGSKIFSDENRVVQLLNDEDEMVRIEMIEACYATKQKRVQEELWDRLKRTQGLEKGYLLLTMAYLYSDKSEKIYDVLLDNIKSTDLYEQMDAYAGLVILGYESYLKDLLVLFNLENYQLRCGVCNLLAELIQNDMVTREAIGEIHKVVVNWKAEEKTIAVKSSISCLLKAIEDKGLRT